MNNLFVVAVALMMPGATVSQFPSSEAWIEADRATIRLDPEKFTELPRTTGILAIGRGPTDPRPQNAVSAIVHAFDRYPLVAIGENHRNQQIHDFIVLLVNDKRFSQKVDDVVVEFGSARYQDVIDRYTAGEAVRAGELRKVWRDTVNILVWDAPVYERFFKTVRTINQQHPKRQLRVLLADPPIDWAKIRDRQDWERVGGTRDQHAAEVVEREVLAKHHRALLIFGSEHVTRDTAFDAYGATPDRKANVVELLEARHPGSVLLIWSHMAGCMTSDLDPGLASWQNPAYAVLKGTWLGAAAVGPRGQTPTLEQLADGFLYLGPTARLTNSRPSPRIYSDTVYLRELRRRNKIQGGSNTSELNRLQRMSVKGRTQDLPPQLR